MGLYNYPDPETIFSQTHEEKNEAEVLEEDLKKAIHSSGTTKRLENI